ncbi:MAG: type II toxin-antitoxin system RelE/ParE family toxin [Nitrospirota bacterium]
MLVFYYTAGSGRRPVEEFIRALPARLQAATLRAVERIAEQGIAAPGLSLRQVRGKLWEIRIQDGGAVRIFYVTRGAEGEGRLILLHAYRKKTQKAPLREIEVAERRMKEVLG